MRVSRAVWRGWGHLCATGGLKRDRKDAGVSPIADDIPAQPPRRARFIDSLNLALRTGRKVGLLDRPVLDRETLMEDARRDAGLHDFGDPWFIGALDAMLESVAGEARLNPAGELSAQKTLHHLLRDRLYAQMWFDRHPEILARPIRNPVVIVGPMRSGTTRMQRLLAADRRFAHLRSFETISPVPRPGFEEVMAGKEQDFRPVLAKRIMRVARLANPRTLSIHPTGPYEPEEELGLIAASFYGMKFEAQWQVPSFARWCESADAVPAYRHMADLLRLIGWSQQESSLRPWILKTPQHMLDLPALMEVFPDARLIFTHRDPKSVVGSAASLAWSQTDIYSDHADAHGVGREWLRKTEAMIGRMRAAREAIPAAQMIDVQYDAMEADWRSAMERVYRFLDLDIAPALAGMEDYIARSAALKRTPHRYDLAQFGLTEGEVYEALGDYVRHFDVPVEGEDIGTARAIAAG